MRDVVAGRWTSRRTREDYRPAQRAGPSPGQRSGLGGYLAWRLSLT